MYTMCAVSVAISHALEGKKSKAEYLKNPLSYGEEDKKNEVQERKKKEETMTEEQKKKECEKLLCQLQIMKINFENTH